MDASSKQHVQQHNVEQKKDESVERAPKRQRTEIEACRKLSAIESLPHEILVMILRHFDSLELAGLHVISKHFNDVLRSSPTLWRDAMFLEGDTGNAFMAPALQRLKELHSRSGGKIDRLGIVVDVEHRSDAKHDFVEMLKVLTKSDVRDLYVELKPWRKVRRRPGDDSVCFTSRPYETLHKLLRSALAKCTSLEFLSLHTDSPYRFGSLSLNDRADCALLKHLHLDGFSAWNIFASSQRSLLFTRLEVLHIGCDDAEIRKEDICAILLGCRESICDLYICLGYMTDDDSASAPLPKIVMPKLRRMSWELANVPFKFVAPRLQHLSLLHRHGGAQVKLTDNRRTFAFTSFGYGGDHCGLLRSSFMRLQDCTKLHSLSLAYKCDHHPFFICGGSKVVRQLSRLPRKCLLRLKQLRVTEDEADLDAYIALAKSVSPQQGFFHLGEKVPLRLKIDANGLKPGQGLTRVNWLADNVRCFELCEPLRYHVCSRVETFEPIGFDGVQERKR